MRGFDPQDPQSEPQLPPKLREAMQRLYEPTIQVPPEIDARILSRARSSYARQRKRWAMARWVGAGLAAAAAVAIAVRVFVSSPVTTPHGSTPSHQLAVAGDINGDGRVNILDAYVVADALAHHRPLNPAWDVNGDGAIDQKDIDLLARIAVRVGPEEAR